MPTEVIIVIAVIAVLFGSAQIPKFARSLGQAKTEFEKAQKDPKKEESKSSSEKKDES